MSSQKQTLCALGNARLKESDWGGDHKQILVFVKVLTHKPSEGSA